VRNVDHQPLAAHSTATFDLTAGIGNVSQFTGAITGTVTVQGTTGAGDLVVFASTGEAASDTYQTHLVSGQSVATGIVAEVLQGLNGVVPESFYNNSSTTVTVSFDVSGYFAATFY